MKNSPAVSLGETNKTIGDYKIGKTIGQGAFSKVKLAIHAETGAKVFSTRFIVSNLLF